MPQAITTVSVKDYGATGDGATDDTVAINNALAKFNGVYFPPGTYMISDSLVIKSEQRLVGEGRSSVITKTKSAFSMIVADQVDDIVIERLALEGNEYGTDVFDSAGVYVSNSSRITIRGCYFRTFGQVQSPYVGAAIVCTNNSEYLLIDGNVISDGVGTTAGETTDILLYQNSGNAVISNNFCLSPNSQGISVNAASGDPKGRVSILGNISKNHTRHGIMIAYTTGLIPPLNTLVANNIVTNNGQSGIYMNSPNLPNRTGGGAVVIEANIVDQCCDVAPGDGTNGGIVINGAHGSILIANNLVRRIAESELVTTNVPGILVNDGSEPILIGNVVEKCRSGAAWFIRCDRLTVKDCVFRSNGDRQICISGEDTVNPESIIITGNRIIGDGVDSSGIYAVGWSEEVFTRVILSDNEIVGVGEGAAGTYGFTCDRPLVGVFTNNVIADHAVGVRFGTTISDATHGDLLFAQNTITRCTTGVSVNFSSSPDRYGFSLQNWYSGNTINVGGGTAARLKMATSIFPKKAYFDTAAPASGAWVVGDMVTNSAPTTGSPIGWMCTAAGSPGTWTAMPNL
ncbi:MAG: right-handed parallel beta-helix repeat-containing protein [Phycisphaeraceae bacterium]|nr:right-handed parallel beta-helix repeat-containing protein [Phycisphaeraceae bacterium]